VAIRGNRLPVGGLDNLHLSLKLWTGKALLPPPGVSQKSVVVTGYTGIDALLWIARQLDTQHKVSARAEVILG
jgi:hypothetical protein